MTGPFTRLQNFMTSGSVSDVEGVILPNYPAYTDKTPLTNELIRVVGRINTEENSKIIEVGPGSDLEAYIRFVDACKGQDVMGYFIIPKSSALPKVASFGKVKALSSGEIESTFKFQTTEQRDRYSLTSFYIMFLRQKSGG